LSIVRQTLLAIFSIALMSCGESSKPAPPLFPETVGAWRLQQSASLTETPEQIRRLGIRRAGTAIYEGAGILKIESYEMTSDAGALEAEQTWKPVANTVAFHKNGFFRVVHWDNADKQAVGAFVRELEKR
jgi:hypothetical protein